MRGFFHHRGQGAGSDRNFSHRDGFGRGFGGFGGGREAFMERFRGMRGGRDGRGFGHGGLRLVLLKLIEEKPSHGYELIKAVEERFNGAYSPSPGVIYPTLSWLEDEGFITISPGEDGRKSAQITDAGKAFLTEKADQVAELFTMMDGQSGEHGDYAPLYRAMGNLKASLKARGMKPMGKTEIEAVVDLLDDLAKKIERL
ncbi:PadR family transcriptional regulator [Asticcacaulis sp. 201]|uniref:PadR family transcriptional regulator n=1 Tax=Asticcacaulis sp. 201 TaxID=3028787 RepID=UPI0029166F75|nr:PadR family transcriptional regulator [Asticcacaulis sp. 201]MDV6329526.1 PadR family transcriptional regulator [Asticcacaulis sp. 201]